MEEQVIKTPGGGKKKWIFVLAAVLAVIVLLGLLLFRVNQFYLCIEPEGEWVSPVEFGSEYVQPDVNVLVKRIDLIYRFIWLIL